ncbi:MAG: hypothetical protein HYU39_10455 [Thaumarchaeota archaeon]|nr:hypothetical protein [Nitrososphaerota archaeon]
MGDAVMGKSRIALALALVALVVSMATFGVAAAQRTSLTGTSGEERAKQLLQIFDRAKIQVQQVFQSQESQGVQIPQAARNRMDDALRLGEQAVQDFNRGRFDDAGDKAVKALNMLSNSLRASPADSVGERDRERVIGLGQAIGRHQEFLNKLQALIDAAKDRGFNTAELERRLASARAELAKAAELLAAGNESEAAKSIGGAQRAVAGAMGEVEKLAKAEKTRGVDAQVKVLAERLTHEEERIKRLPLQVQQALAADLSKARERAEEARKKLELNEVDDAVESLRKAAENLKKGFSRIEEEKDKIEKALEKSVESLNDRLKQLESKAKDVRNEVVRRQLLRTIDELKQLLGKLKDAISEHSQREVTSQMERAEKILEELARRIEATIRTEGTGGNAGRTDATSQREQIEELLDELARRIENTTRTGS